MSKAFFQTYISFSNEHLLFSSHYASIVLAFPLIIIYFWALLFMDVVILKCLIQNQYFMHQFLIYFHKIMKLIFFFQTYVDSDFCSPSFCFIYLCYLHIHSCPCYFFASTATWGKIYLIFKDKIIFLELFCKNFSNIWKVLNYVSLGIFVWTTL